MEDNKMEIGTIKIADEVVQIVAGLALGDITGISSAGGSIAGGIADMLSGKKNIAKGVKVDVKENDVIVDLRITVEYGVCIPDIAWEIQEKVKRDIETMTNMNVVKVNIFIEGVNIDKVIKKEDLKPSEKVELDYTEDANQEATNEE